MRFKIFRTQIAQTPRQSLAKWAKNDSGGAKAPVGAGVSSCRTWLYKLSRRWFPAGPAITFTGLNPSTADEINDATVRRRIGFARRWGLAACTG